MRTKCLCFSVLKVASGPMVKLVDCKSALTSPHPRPSSPRWFIIVLTVLRQWSRCCFFFFFFFFFVLFSLFFFFFFFVCLFLVLTLYSFVVYSTWRFILSFPLCFVLVFFSPFSIAITTLGEERAGSVCFSCVSLFCACWFISFSSSSSWSQGLAATCDCGTPGLFFLPLCTKTHD